MPDALGTGIVVELSSSELPTSPEAALRLIQQVVDTLPQFIFWKDRNSVFLGCNERFARVAGCDSPAEIVGKTDFDLAWKREEAEWFRKVDQRVMASGRAEFHILEPQKQSDGKEAWLDTNKIPLIDGTGAVIGILGTFEDVTTRKAEEDAKQHKKRLESIGKLAGGIAHDFNNLLGGIIGATELLQRRAASDVDKELLGEILRTSERAADLTNKLLAFSRRGSLQIETLSIHEAIENVAPLLRRGLDARIDMRLELRAKRHHVRGDASEIELALLNLGLNARDVMPEGGVLRIFTEQVELSQQDCQQSRFNVRPGTYVRIGVEDTGPGIDQELRERVFEPFFTTKDTGAGTGLGLAAVYGAVQAHRGAVQVDPTKENGARFLIDLPVCDDAPPLMGSREAQPQLRLSGKALIADDEVLLRRATAERLKRLGFEVLEAGSGEEALSAFQAHQDEIALVLLDVVMPKMGGVECCQRIRQLRPGLPLILSSGFTKEQLVRGDDRTADVVFLKKPYVYSTLLRAIEDAMGGTLETAREEPGRGD